MFERFGRVTRVFLAMDRDTQLAKGFAFISFQERTDAARACEKMDGCMFVSSPYILLLLLNHLILHPDDHSLLFPPSSRFSKEISPRTNVCMMSIIDGFKHLILKVEFAKRSQ